jgi:hypothetical protein
MFEHCVLIRKVVVTKDIFCGLWTALKKITHKILCANIKRMNVQTRFMFRHLEIRFLGWFI